MHAHAPAIRDELNAADRVLGDGDTGMTIASVVDAWDAACTNVPEAVGPLLQQLARETRRASGSSLASVLGIGLMAAGKVAGEGATVDEKTMAGMLDAAVAAIQERSGATPGDKTVLDTLIAIRDAPAKPEQDAVDAATAAATFALETFRAKEARVGRARVYGAKSIGHDDPGMLSLVLLLRAIRR
jgi:dihydroxyacetone kinase-like protein